MKPLAELLPSHAAPSLVAVVAVASVMTGCLVLVDSLGFGTAYVDANCNGVKDPEEMPLAGVYVWTSGDALAPTPSREECDSEDAQTDSEGESAVAWYSGSSCDEVFVFAQAPDGFQPTTDTVVNDCDGEFGFAREGTCPPRSIVQPEGNRCLCWGSFLGIGLALFVLAYRKHRSETRAGESGTSGQ